MYRMIENLRNLRQFLLLASLLLISEWASAQVTADFTSNTASGCSPLIVNFSNLSTGTGLSYSWNLGNGNTSVSENPSASYINPGTYTSMPNIHAWPSALISNASDNRGWAMYGMARIHCNRVCYRLLPQSIPYWSLFGSSDC